MKHLFYEVPTSRQMSFREHWKSPDDARASRARRVHFISLLSKSISRLIDANFVACAPIGNRGTSVSDFLSITRSFFGEANVDATTRPALRHPALMVTRYIAARHSLRRRGQELGSGDQFDAVCAR
jgi:hypothetical protein